MAGEGGKPQAPHHHPHIRTADAGMPMSQIIIVGLVVAVLGGGSIWYLNRAGEDNKLNSLFHSQDSRKISTASGQRGDITLSDGSKISIGPATKLTIIPDYNKQYRGVMVEGTAAFDVKASSGTPLEVRAGGGAFVLDEGGFVVRAYPDEDGVIFNLTAGKALVRAKDTRREVSSPTMLRVAKDSTVGDVDAATVEVATSWSSGKMMLRGTTLRDALPLFDKYYALKFDVKDAKLLDRSVTIEAELDSKQKAITALEKSAYVKFAYDGTTPTLRDDPAAAARAAKARP